MKQLHAFFFSPVPIETLGAFRIGVSLFALIQTLTLMPDWMWFYGPSGLLPWEISDALSTSHTPAVSDLSKLMVFFGISTERTVQLATVAYVISLISLLVGYKTRVAGISAWLLHMMFTTTGHFLAYGVETFTHISLFYCAVFPVGASWSIDRLKSTREPLPDYLVACCIRVVQLHLCISYLATGMEKAAGEQWWNGEAIWIALQQDQFNQINTEWLAQIPFVTKFLCWSTLALEITYPIGILWNKTKKIYFLAMMGMHAFIMVFLGLYLFGLLMIVLNLSIFGEHVFPGIWSKKIASRYQRFTEMTSIMKKKLVRKQVQV